MNRLDELFRQAVSAIDAGDASVLDRLLAAHSELLSARLDDPGAWLRDKVGDAVAPGGFFERPYLLWFVAEDPVRHGKLPANIASLARSIIRAAAAARVESLPHQLSYALQLVSLSWIARQCNVQIELIDVLVDAGASPAGQPDHALVNGNMAAAQHLVTRGAPLTLSTALCLKRWEDAARLLPAATDRQKQFALVLVALRGHADAIQWLVERGVDINRPSEDLYSHATPVHHAVGSGSLASVRALVEAGAALGAQDTAWNATPLGWAEYYVDCATVGNDLKEHAAIADYLRSRTELP